tara:strand:- start:1801 stop:1929 length:129 start_codon:yes stop_codon:yes gene_type:complete
MFKVNITFSSDLQPDEINKILEDIFYDGSYFDEFEDVDWKIK